MGWVHLVPTHEHDAPVSVEKSSRKPMRGDIWRCKCGQHLQVVMVTADYDDRDGTSWWTLSYTELTPESSV